MLNFGYVVRMNSKRLCQNLFSVELKTYEDGWEELALNNIQNRDAPFGKDTAPFETEHLIHAQIKCGNHLDLFANMRTWEVWCV